MFAIPASAKNLPGTLAARKSGETTIAYICRGTACSAPVHSLEELTNELRKA
jgi:uncharacterized protein YyaL (SSP411 family)